MMTAWAKTVIRGKRIKLVRNTSNSASGGFFFRLICFICPPLLYLQRLLNFAAVSDATSIHLIPVGGDLPDIR